MKHSAFEIVALNRILLSSLPMPEQEYRFHKVRRWKFDFCWPEYKVAVECEGGSWLPKARHTSGVGFRGDCGKYNMATKLGWRVLRYTPDMIDELVIDVKDLLTTLTTTAETRL